MAMHLHTSGRQRSGHLVCIAAIWGLSFGLALSVATHQKDVSSSLLSSLGATKLMHLPAIAPSRPSQLFPAVHRDGHAGFPQTRPFVHQHRAALSEPEPAATTRNYRSLVSSILLCLSAFAFIWAVLPSPTLAFSNAIPEAAQWDTFRKTRGPKPADLGLVPRKEIDGELGLKSCRGSPNCFSTSGPFDEQLVAPWLPPAGVSSTEALEQLKGVVERYPPGQQGIDGGGFQIQVSKPNYLYIQFESAKHGYIDDVEFAANPDGPGVLLRSSSRIGYLDFRVNGKRLNWISNELEKLGWTAPQITAQTHPDYFYQNPE